MPNFTIRSPPSRAAWIEIISPTLARRFARSPPSRAAWIEMLAAIYLENDLASPPSRAAWIEIIYSSFVAESNNVAAFTGGVD
mgnify:CR=1 FL=1